MSFQHHQKACRPKKRSSARFQRSFSIFATTLSSWLLLTAVLKQNFLGFKHTSSNVSQQTAVLSSSDALQRCRGCCSASVLAVELRWQHWAGSWQPAHTNAPRVAVVSREDPQLLAVHRRTVSRPRHRQPAMEENIPSPPTALP